MLLKTGLNALSYITKPPLKFYFYLMSNKNVYTHFNFIKKKKIIRV